MPTPSSAGRPVRLPSERRRRWSTTLSLLVATLPLLGIGMVLILIGWPLDARTEGALLGMTRAIALLYGPLFLVNWYTGIGKEAFSRLHRILFIGCALLIFFSALMEDPLASWMQIGLPRTPLRFILFGIAAAQQASLLLLDIATWLPRLQAALPRRLNPGTVFFGSFALLIGAGTGLLKMPNATTGGISWTDALFTSTSAVCVTGLIVVDTATAFTALGQGLLIALIQLGAFGIVTLTFFLAILTGQGFSVAGRVLLKDVLNVENLHGLRKAVLFLIAFTLCIEGLGWFCLFQTWSHGDTVIPNLLWVSLFHAVSAFCNAGFSLFSEGLTHPAAIGNLSAQGTLLILIVIGGLGFPVLMEAGSRLASPFRAAGPRRFSIHTRLVLLTTTALLIVGTGLLYISDPGAPGESPPQRLWRALFTAVTSRTAGFHISEMSALSGAATSIVVVLMFIGGSPGSFAGGVKTTTFALSLITVRHILLARREVQLFGRRITESLCNRAFAVLLLSLMWIVAATTVLLFLEPACPFLDLLFETVSAFATVGLSRGVTADLSDASKLVLSLTMFVGRIGVLNFLFSLLIIPPRERRLSLPPERLIIE